MRKFIVNVNGTSYEVEVEEIAAGSVAQRPASTPAPAPEAPKSEAAPAAQSVAVPAGGESISAPMPGTILSVNVKVGDTVKSGDVLFILEAMKLENEIMAPCNGTVTHVNAVRGASVNSGDVLCVIA